MKAASWRAGQRFSSMSSACDDLLDQAELVVGVEDGEVGLAGPTSSAWRRRILAPMEWKVPSHGMPSATGPTSSADALLHLARRLVGEGDGEDLRGPARPVAMRWAMRVVSTRVLPVPAPASTSTGPSVASTACALLGVEAGEVGLARATRRAGARRKRAGPRLGRRIVESGRADRLGRN